MEIKIVIEGEIYEKLIDYALKECDAIMFVARKDGLNIQQLNTLNKTLNNIQSKLKSALLKKRNGSYWVFTKVGYSQLQISTQKDESNFNDLFEIYFYKTTSKIKQYLLTQRNLYRWLNPDYPEDLAFFKNGYCWLYSVAHEEICEIYVQNEKEYEYLKSIGISFAEDHYIPTKKEELYYEEY